MAIDEKKLIEDCKKYLEGRYTFQIPLEYSIAMTRLCEIIEAQPKLSLETKTSDKWIPCSERLPEENGSYIVTSMDYVDTFEAVFDAGEWFSIDYCDDIKNVIAWMPLPEPYKGDE